MPFSIFGLNLATIFQVVALLAVLFFEFRVKDKRWRIGVIVAAIVVSTAAGVLEWRHQVSEAERNSKEREQAQQVLSDIGNGVAQVEQPIADISNTSREGLAEIRALQGRNAEQRTMISSLRDDVQRANSQYLAAQDRVVSLSQQVAVLQEQLARDAQAAEAARAVAAQERQRQTAAANMANAQAACAASYSTGRTDTGSWSSQQYVDLRPYGGGRCLNGVYYPPN